MREEGKEKKRKEKKRKEKKLEIKTLLILKNFLSPFPQNLFLIFQYGWMYY